MKTGSILKTALELPINNLYTPEEDLSKLELPANIQYDFQNNKDSNPTNQHLNPAKYFKRILLLESPKRYNPDFLKEPFYPQYFGKPEDKKSLEFLGKRVPENSSQHGGDAVFGPNKRWSEFLGKRMSEFLGKRNDKRWSEFLGKRQEYQQPTIFQKEASKRWSEFLGK